PLVGDRLNLGLVVTNALEVVESHQLHAVTGGANLLVDLEAALNLRSIELAEGTIAGEHQILRMFVELLLGRRRGRIREIVACGRAKRNQQHAGTADAD